MSHVKVLYLAQYKELPSAVNHLADEHCRAYCGETEHSGRSHQVMIIVDNIFWRNWSELGIALIQYRWKTEHSGKSHQITGISGTYPGLSKLQIVWFTPYFDVTKLFVTHWDFLLGPKVYLLFGRIFHSLFYGYVFLVFFTFHFS